MTEALDPFNKWDGIVGIQPYAMTLSVLRDRYQILRKLNRGIAEVVEVLRKQRVSPAKIRFHVAGQVRTWPLHDGAAREVVDRIATVRCALRDLSV